MKNIILALLCAITLPLMAKVGETFPIEKLPTVWYMGEQPTTWQNNHIYIFEFWASWCGPCLQAIPHMESLWQTYKDKGVTIIGINVEPNQTPDQLKALLASQRVQPTYIQAHDFNKEFARSLKIIGIPYSFVVRDGKIIWQGHPVALKTEKLNELLNQ